MCLALQFFCYSSVSVSACELSYTKLLMCGSMYVLLSWLRVAKLSWCAIVSTPPPLPVLRLRLCNERERERGYRVSGWVVVSLLIIKCLDEVSGYNVHYYWGTNMFYTQNTYMHWHCGWKQHQQTAFSESFYYYNAYSPLFPPKYLTLYIIVFY